jgi:hypothetical protein
MKKFLSGILFGLLFLTFFVSPVSANHSWGGYHWARTANPFTLKLGDNLTNAWDPYLATASTDWSVSDVLDTNIVTGSANPKNCRATAGRVEVCNSKYGNNGWLGIAQIWISGGDHITQGTTKMNDTYFNTAKYNTPAWKQLVVCQEVAHTFGLDHQDETFENSNLGTCMDYTNNPLTNQHPNAHDYEELEIIYAHVDSFTTVDMTTGQIAKQLGQLAASQNLDNPGEWGRLVRDNGKVGTYERDFGFGNKVVTHVIWAE